MFNTLIFNRRAQARIRQISYWPHRQNVLKTAHETHEQLGSKAAARRNVCRRMAGVSLKVQRTGTLPRIVPVRCTSGHFA